ncbi:MAG: monoamine oxidase, partial [Pseudonocardiales bacterium]|nr:monoamine oxidase [Pseudonocardiales bacterium]
AGRVYFAGDWLSHEVSWQHGSFTSAQKTVTALHTRALAT